MLLLSPLFFVQDGLNLQVLNNKRAQLLKERIMKVLIVDKEKRGLPLCWQTT
jgi:hypothetical protein